MFKNYLDLQAEYLRSQRKKRKKSDKQKKSDIDSSIRKTKSSS